jgi:CheY-like chemotaxis protein
MPVMNGRSFIRQIAAEPALAEIPVVLMSTGEIGLPELASLGAKALLKKPLFGETFLATVQQWHQPDPSNRAD